jgi:hypothetical protein
MATAFTLDLASPWWLFVAFGFVRWLGRVLPAGNGSRLPPALRSRRQRRGDQRSGTIDLDKLLLNWRTCYSESMCTLRAPDCPTEEGRSIGERRRARGTGDTAGHERRALGERTVV